MEYQITASGVIRSIYEIRIKYYESLLVKLRQFHKKGEITFLEYQGLSFLAIDKVLNKYGPYREPKARRRQRMELIHIWESWDPLVIELENLKEPIGSSYQKIRLIGEALAKQYMEKWNILQMTK